MPEDEPNQPLDFKSAVIVIAILFVIIISDRVPKKFIWGNDDSWKFEIIFCIISFALVTAIVIFYYFKNRKK